MTSSSVLLRHTQSSRYLLTWFRRRPQGRKCRSRRPRAHLSHVTVPSIHDATQISSPRASSSLRPIRNFDPATRDVESCKCSRGCLIDIMINIFPSDIISPIVSRVTRSCSIYRHRDPGQYPRLSEVVRSCSGAACTGPLATPCMPCHEASPATQ